MTTKMTPADQDQELRKRAEAAAEGKAAGLRENIEGLTVDEIRQMLYELRVHQIELEMQNEELRRAQEELDAARARYFDLYHLAPIGYVTVSEKGLLLEANLTAATLWGVSRTSLISQPISRFIIPEDQDIYYSHRNKLFASGEPQSCEVRMMNKDGTQFWARLQAIVTQDEGAAPVSRVVVSDISERKQAEEDRRKLDQLKLEQQIQQTQKLESLGVLASGIAHDFNNLMGGIFGYIDLALVKSKDETVSGYLSKAIVTIERARGLTSQLLTFAKGGAPVQKIIPLFPFIQETAQFALSGSNVTSRFDVAEDLWPCNIDKTQIAQVVNNIIINAQQAMPHGGTIEVSARNISLTGSEVPGLTQASYVKISFKDNGIGILNESLPRIFDPFYTTKTKGRGLGLATCYSIIHRHSGAIEVESEPGRGSTFHVYLPASMDFAHGAAGEVITHKGSGTFIVMDDEEVLRDTIKIMLESLGYTVVCRADGRDAVNFYNEAIKTSRAIRGVILDLTVPGGMGGKAAVGEIRKLNKEIPVFAASGYGDDPVMKNPKGYGFTASISKPFRLGELAEMLENNMPTQE
jgi:two-component system, cell cycle sensor histidine kinase and response regulator CckA